MLLRARHGNIDYVLTLRDRSLSVSRDDRWTAAADRGGRLYSWFEDGVMYRRGLNGRILRKWHDDRGRHSEPMSPEEASRVLDDASRLFRSAVTLQGLAGWTWQDDPPPPATLEALIDAFLRAAAFDSGAAAEDAARFDAVYDRVGILPPDHYLSLVLQATEGCSFGTCAFCSLYDGRFRIKSPEEFRSHIEAVRTYFGRSLTLRERSVFLGSANALAVPMARLVAFFEAITASLGRPSRGIHAFVDGFTGERKTVADYARLRDLGLKRVYVGLESGHDPLLEAVRKPSSAAQVIETVARLRDVGVSVAVIVITGLGGERFAREHVADTAAAVNAMNLGAGDLLFLSDLVETPDMAPGALPGEMTRALSAPELDAQRADLLSRLVFPGVRPKVAAYDIREFLY